MFDIFIRCISELFMPVVEPNWQSRWCVVNLLVCAVTLFSVTAMYTTLYGGSFSDSFFAKKWKKAVQRKGNPTAVQGNSAAPQGGAATTQGKTMLWGAVTAGILTVLMLFFHYYLEAPDETFPLHQLAYPFVSWIDTILNLRGILSIPTPLCPWLGILSRHVYIFLIIFGIQKVGYAAGVVTQQFVEYLKNTFNETNIDAALGSKIVKRVLRILGIFIGVSGVTTAVTESENLLDFSKNFLDGLMEILEKITLIAQLPTNPATLSELAFAFLITFLSIGMIMVYATIISVFFSFIAVIWEKKDKFPEWFRTYVVPHLKYILWTVVVLAVLSVLVTFCVNFDKVVQLATNFIQNSPTTIFALVQQIVLTSLGACIGILMLTFLISFWKFAVVFYNNWKNKLSSIKKGSVTAEKIVRFFGAIIVILVLLVAFVWAYDYLRDWMIDRVQDREDGYGTWWLAGQCCSLLFAISFLIIGVALAAAMCLSALIEIGQFFFPGNQTGGRLSGFIKHFVRLISNVFMTLLTVGESYIDTILRIFVGYKTESQKNNAMFVAACFASLASLLNTYLGLYNFNHREDSIIPTITSLAIAFSVQLAMLISGMKAGQGMAESIVNDAKLVGSGKRKAIFQKQFICVLYWLFLVGVLCGTGLLAGQMHQNLTAVGGVALAVILVCTVCYMFGVMTQKLWMVYLPVVVLFGGYLFCNGLPQAISSMIPIILTSLAALAFAYGITTQMLDIESIRAMKDQTGGAAPTPKQPKPRRQKRTVPAPGMDMSQLVLSKPRRIPARYHFAVYILLMIVSTGFAFNNLFGCYAAQTQLKNQAYQQIRTYAEKAVNDKVQEIVQEYTDNEAQLVDGMTKRISWLEQENAANESQLTQDIPASGDPEYNKWFDRHFYYRAEVKDNQLLTAGMKSYLTQDSAAFADIKAFTVYTYLHYRGDRVSPEYTTYAFGFSYEKSPGVIEETTVLGTKYGEPEDTLTITYDGGDIDFVNRIKDPDRDGQTIVVTERTATDPNKYTVMRGMLTVLESIEDKVYNLTDKDNAPISGGAVADEVEKIRLDMHTLLDTNEALDALLESMFGMYKTATSASAETMGGMHQLPVYVNQYLEARCAAPTVGTGLQKSDDADLDGAEFGALEQYINGTINAYTLLSTVSLDDTAVSGNVPGGSAGGSAPAGASDAEDDTIALLREYLNYARGIEKSDFQLSYDTLLHGGFGMNPTLAYAGQAIDALYRAQAIACFILLICMLVDFMAFFSGLLLFQEAFLLDMENSDKLVKLGYINFDAVLTNYFTPCAEDGVEREYDLALIYYLLYCKNIRDTAGQLLVDDDLVSKLKVDADRLKAIIQKAVVFLDEYGVSADDPDFHVWLKSFIQKSAITLQEVHKP